MTQRWTIARIDTGEVLYASFETPSEGSHPKDNGFGGWNSSVMKATRIAKAPDQGSQTWSSTGWADDLTKIRAQLLAAVKADAETRKMAVLSPGGAKKTEYADKAGELRALDTLGGTTAQILAALKLMSADRIAALYPLLSASAAEFGDTIVDAAIRVRAGVVQSAKYPKICAREERACAAIRAATTVAAAKAAAIVAWP